MGNSNIQQSNTAELAEHVSLALHLIGLLAAPVAAKRYGSFPPKEYLIARINEFLAIISNNDAMELGSNQPVSSCRCTIEELTALLDEWTPTVDVPTQIQRAARAVLMALGFPSPDEGWESWHGGIEHESAEALTPDPLPSPTEEELAARPPGYLFGYAHQWLKWLASPKMLAKVHPSDLFRPSFIHIDALLLSLRPFRSEYASARLRIRSLLAELEQLRKDCTDWNGTPPVPLLIRETSRRIVLLLDLETTLEQVMEYEVDLDPSVLSLPESKTE